MSEELEVLAMVAGRLEAAGIAYMVTASIAANCYTVPRMTRDIDVVVELAAGDVDRLLDLFGADFYVDRDAVPSRSSTGHATADRSVPDLDLGYLSHWTARLGLTEGLS